MAAGDAEYQREEPRALGRTGESLTTSVIWEAWVTTGLLGLAVVALIVLWLIYQ
jgi:hypothetical protein